MENGKRGKKCRMICDECLMYLYPHVSVGTVRGSLKFSGNNILISKSNFYKIEKS